MRVLVVDDDLVVRSVVTKALQKAGHAVDEADTGQDGLWLATEVDYDVVVLDGALPDLDGLDVCRRLRAAERWMPVLMLTSRDAVEQRVAGLDSGADDYLVKPFDVEEVLARVRALGRRTATPRPPVLEVADLVVDPATRTATRAGQPIELTAKEFALLELLVRADGTVVTRDRIVDTLWDFAAETDRNVLDVHLRNLRAKVDKPFAIALIETVRGIGYRIRAE